MTVGHEEELLDRVTFLINIFSTVLFTKLQKQWDKPFGEGLSLDELVAEFVVFSAFLGLVQWRILLRLPLIGDRLRSLLAIQVRLRDALLIPDLLLLGGLIGMRLGLIREIIIIPGRVGVVEHSVNLRSFVVVQHLLLQIE